MNYRIITEKIRRELPKNSFNKIAIRIEGRVFYFTERQFRAMQLAVKHMTDSEYEDFCNTVIIYNSPRVRKSSGTIQLTRDGYCDNPIPGFLDTCTELSLSLIDR